LLLPKGTTLKGTCRFLVQLLIKKFYSTSHITF
jgi:hypothetical protein